MKTETIKPSNSEYSENYYNSNPLMRKKKLETAKDRSFKLDELIEIIGMWFYDKSKKYFEDESG